MILDISKHAWMRGRIGVRFLYSDASGGCRYRPTSFTRHDSAAHMAGGIAVGPANAPRDIEQSVLRRSASGGWRIASEMFHH